MCLVNLFQKLGGCKLFVILPESYNLSFFLLNPKATFTREQIDAKSVTRVSFGDLMGEVPSALCHSLDFWGAATSSALAKRH